MNPNTLLIAVFASNVFVKAELALPTYGLACERILKELGVSERYIGSSTSPVLHWFSTDESKPYACVPMKPLN
jgi:hypothetical protein